MMTRAMLVCKISFLVFAVLWNMVAGVMDGFRHCVTAFLVHVGQYQGAQGRMPRSRGSHITQNKSDESHGARFVLHWC